MTDTNTDLTDDELDEIADRVVERIDTESMLPQLGLTKRQFLKLAAGGASAVALGSAGAAADASESDSDPDVGTTSNRVDVFADGVDANSINGNGPVTDGDGTEREIFIIAAGASDPASAGTEDIIFEEQS